MHEESLQSTNLLPMMKAKLKFLRVDFRKMWIPSAEQSVTRDYSLHGTWRKFCIQNHRSFLFKRTFGPIIPVRHESIHRSDAVNSHRTGIPFKNNKSLSLTTWNLNRFNHPASAAQNSRCLFSFINELLLINIVADKNASRASITATFDCS